VTIRSSSAGKIVRERNFGTKRGFRGTSTASGERKLKGKQIARGTGQPYGGGEQEDTAGADKCGISDVGMGVEGIRST